MRGQKRIVDASIVDPELPVWNNITLDYIYNEKH
jgi:hypothetical protein